MLTEGRDTRRRPLPLESTSTSASIDGLPAFEVNKKVKPNEAGEDCVPEVMQPQINYEEEFYRYLAQFSEYLLSDIFEPHSVGNIRSHKLFDSKGNPMPFVLMMMRHLVFCVDRIHNRGSTAYVNLQPDKILIIIGRPPDIIDDASGPKKCVDFSHTQADDLLALGRLLFFCVSGGGRLHGDGSRLMDALVTIKHLPEARDIISRLMDSSPENRPGASEVLQHKLFSNPTFECNLNDLLKPEMLTLVAEMPSYVLFDPLYFYPNPLLWKLMRDMVHIVYELHCHQGIHGKLEPENVWIIFGTSPSVDIRHTDGSKTAGSQADDLFALGRLIYFCVSRGRIPDCHYVVKDCLQIDYVPEAVDIVIRLMDPSAEKRPRASQVLLHPVCWDLRMRVAFLHDVSCLLDEVPKDGALFTSLMEASWAAQDEIHQVKEAAQELGWVPEDGPPPDFVRESILEKLSYARRRYEVLLENEDWARRDEKMKKLLVLDIEEIEQGIRCRHHKMVIEVYKAMCRNAAETPADFRAKYLRFCEQ